MRNYLNLLQVQLKAYLTSPIAYLILGVFSISVGLFFYNIVMWFDRMSMQATTLAQQYQQTPSPLNVNMMAIRPLFHNIAIIVQFLLPGLPIPSAAAEKLKGWVKFLFVRPITNWQVTLVNFASAMIFYLIMLSLTGLHIGLLFLFGNPELNPVLTGYLGLYLMGACFISIRLLIGAIVKNPAIIFVSAFTVNLTLLALGWLSNFTSPNLAELLTYWSPVEHFDDFSKGIIDSKHVVFYVSFCFALVFLTYMHVENSARKTLINIRTGGITSTHGGIFVEPIKSDTTRCMAASVLQKGSLFRSRILHYVNERHKALAPEPGIDITFITKLCKFLENRDTKYLLTLCLLSTLYLLVVFIVSLNASISGKWFIPVTILFFIAAWIVRLHKGRVEYKWLTSFFLNEKYDPEGILKEFKLNNNLESNEVISQNTQNLLIYDGFVPFVGAGIELGGWSFAVDLSQPKGNLGQDENVLPFEIEDLYREIDVSLNELNLKGMQVHDVLIVKGNDIRKEKWILPDLYTRPTGNVDSMTIKRFVNNSEPRIRHYKWIQVYDWGNEMVVSYFVRYSRHGKKMFVEVSVLLLTPIEDEYRSVDKIIPDDKSNMLQLGIGYLFITPFYILYAWLALVGKFLSWFYKRSGFEERRIREQIKNDPFYNYGSKTSLRQEISTHQFEHYFQRIDNEMYVKIIQKELLDTLVRFLDMHNIDTSDLKERQTTILNNGILVQRGDVRAETMAVGVGAQASTATTTMTRTKK